MKSLVVITATILLSVSALAETGTSFQNLPSFSFYGSNFSSQKSAFEKDFDLEATMAACEKEMLMKKQLVTRKGYEVVAEQKCTSGKSAPISGSQEMLFVNGSITFLK